MNVYLLCFLNLWPYWGAVLVGILVKAVVLLAELNDGTSAQNEELYDGQR